MKAASQDVAKLGEVAALPLWAPSHTVIVTQ